MPDFDRLLSDLDYYMAFINQVMGFYRERHDDKELGDLSAAMYAEVHDLLNDPARMKALARDHLGHMWQRYIEPAWEAALPVLEESLAAYQQLDFSGLTALEAIRAVTERDLAGHWDRELRRVETLIFVPSAHIGPFVRMVRNHDKTVAHIVFGARLPQGSRLHSPALNRSELLVQMAALADNTRLEILHLLTQHEELCAQDIMTMLDLSQSSASRHLRQLTATGYLLERRQDVAKCYSLNQARVEDTLQTLRRFLTTG
jgi:DNA-binding transcriptional ArsR family regulator